jgi:hypothetical protein
MSDLIESLTPSQSCQALLDLPERSCWGLGESELVFS